LIASETEKDIEEVLSVIGKKVVLKKTGLVQSSKGGGGQLKFLERQIFRQRGDKAIFLGLPEDYLKTTFQSFGLKAGSRSAPDITSMVDQEGKELTLEAYSRFRSALGKLSCLSKHVRNRRHRLLISQCTCKLRTTNPRRDMNEPLYPEEIYQYSSAAMSAMSSDR
jgi:hypothetical protein